MGLDRLLHEFEIKALLLHSVQDAHGFLGGPALICVDADEMCIRDRPDGFASSLGEGAFGKEEKLYRTAKGPISEGAVTEGDWRS